MEHSLPEQSAFHTQRGTLQPQIPTIMWKHTEFSSHSQARKANATGLVLWDTTNFLCFVLWCVNTQNPSQETGGGKRRNKKHPKSFFELVTILSHACGVEDYQRASSHKEWCFTLKDSKKPPPPPPPPFSSLSSSPTRPIMDWLLMLSSSYSVSNSAERVRSWQQQGKSALKTKNEVNSWFEIKLYGQWSGENHKRESKTRYKVMWFMWVLSEKGVVAINPRWHYLSKVQPAGCRTEQTGVHLTVNMYTRPSHSHGNVCVSLLLTSSLANFSAL